MIESNQYRNKLADLLYDASSQFQINFNNHKLQKEGKDIATCGKHVISRILNRDLTIDQYNKWLKNNAKRNKISTDKVADIIYRNI